MMARTKRHAGGAKSALSKRFSGEHPGATPRTESIRNFIERETIRRDGVRPSILEIARAFAMAESKVEHHVRVLGLL